jgi:transposase
MRDPSISKSLSLRVSIVVVNALPPIWPRHFFGVLEWDSERWSTMEGIGRKADGRRIFSVEFKRQAVGRVLSGEKTLAELSRELEVQPSVLRNWMRLVERGGTAAVAAGEGVVVPASRVRELEQQVKDLQRLVGKQAMTIEVLEAARELVKKSPHLFKGSVR